MNINLIPDIEIVLTKENDFLGTIPYVEIIKQIINNSKRGFTIGLFGAWGSGKSSIVKSTLEDYKKKEEKYCSFYYDAWKYHDLSFKRKFILELASKLSFDSKYINEKLYETAEIEEDKGAVINYDWLIKVILYCAAIIPIVAIIISFLEGSLSDTRAYVTAMGILFTFIVKIVEELLKRDKKKKRISPIHSIEQFEVLFTKIIEDSPVFEKIIVVIDNIDRCNPSEGKEVLDSVKNFLGHPKLIYIIPIDNEILKFHYRMSDASFSEFQRKIFDASIIIREYSNNELLNYACELNEKYKLNLPVEVLDICTSIYSKNPRRIIDLINKIQLERQFVNIQEKNKNIVSGKLSSNLSGLAKLLLIKEEWTELYSKIKNDHSFLNRLNDE